VNSKKKGRVRSERYEGLTIDPNHPTPVSESQDAPASVGEIASADPAILQKELAARKDDYLRLAADFDNFKKRTRRDSEQQAAAEKEAFIRDLLPIQDNLERALACGQSASSESLQQGVEMTLQQLGQLLQRHGIEVMKELGQPFDPHRHEAVSVRHDPGQPDHVVLEVIQHGYCRGDKVFRPARVIVNDGNHSPGPNDAR
jgi:molecular chaperone GrpE